MKVGLFFGSFNPIHKGHVSIANFMANKTDLNRVWLVVSPHNPLKDKHSLADAKKRLVAVRKSVRGNSRVRACNVEFSLPQPSYTIHTLDLLKKKYPRTKFVLIIGSDNLNLLPQWRAYKRILKEYQIYVYPRHGPGGGKFKNHPNVVRVKAPRIDISSTHIRERIREGKAVSRLLA